MIKVMIEMKERICRWARLHIVRSAGLILICGAGDVGLISAQDPFPAPGHIYNDSIVARVDIFLPSDSLDVILAPGNEESDYHFHATFIFHDGTTRDTFKNAGFRLRGNTSRYSAKKSFKVSLNTYAPGRLWHGVEKLNLNGEHNDPTVSRARVCWDLLRDIGVPAPRAGFVELYINTQRHGLYANIEHIDEEFVETRFGNNDGNLYKCLYPADLAYLGVDPDLYKLTSGNRRVYELHTNEEDDNYSDLAHFIDVLNNTPIDELRCALEEVFNVHSFLKSMAFDVLSGNWDGPLYNKNNFYLYHNLSTGRFEYIPYDLDNTFGIDWFGIDWDTRDMYSWGHPGEPRPLYWRVLEVPEYRDWYSYYMQQIIARVYRESLPDQIDGIKVLIAPFVERDPYYPLDYGFTIDDFNSGFEQELDYHHTPIGLKTFIANRRAATIAQLEINNIVPAIRDLSHTNAGTSEPISIHVVVEDDQGIAQVEWCYQLEGMGEVLCVDMYDDGLHADGEAGDGSYGVTPDLQGMPGVVTYFVRATDHNGKSNREPVCGMREVFAGNPMVTLAINELMASNDTTVADEYGEFDDWVEIHNYGDEDVYLGDRFLSDNPDNPRKWQLPDMWMQPGDFLIVWADDDEEQGDLHTSYKLSADGEFIGIFDNSAAGNALIDGTEFGPQETDVAFGRLPDAHGPFQVIPATPGWSNALSSAVEIVLSNYPALHIFPNPAMTTITLATGQPVKSSGEVALYNVFGHLALREHWPGRSRVIDVTHLPAGVYTVVLREAGIATHLGRAVKL